MEVAEDHVRLRVVEQPDRLAAGRGQSDDDEALALEQRPDAELHDRVVLHREHAQDPAGLALRLGRRPRSASVSAARCASAASSGS